MKVRIECLILELRDKLGIPFKPEKELAKLGIQKGQTILGFGCGAGSFALPVAKMVGEKGKVYALDKQPFFIKKVKDNGWFIHENSNIKVEWFQKNKDYFPFFGRDIETLLAKVKIAHSKRVFCKAEDDKKKITLVDLEKGFEMFIKNSDNKSKKEAEDLKKQLYSSIYS